MILPSMRALINSTMSMQEHLNIAVVAAIMVGDGDSKCGKNFAKALFLWIPSWPQPMRGGSARNVASVRARSLLDKIRAGYIAASINWRDINSLPSTDTTSTTPCYALAA